MDFAVVIIYLLVVLVVGMRRGYRINSIREYAVGDKNFSIAVLIATISATYIGGGSTLGSTERIFKAGLIYALVIIICNLIYKFTIAYVITPLFDRLQHCISFGEVMGSFYQRPAQILTGFFGAIRCMSIFATQTTGMAFIFNFFLGTSFELAVIVSTLIVILYTTFGGIRAVAITDFIQFAVLIVGIAVIANFSLIKVGGYSELWQKLPYSHKYIFSDKKVLLDHLVMLFIMGAPFLDPAQIQRLLLSNNRKKAQISMFAALAIDPIVFFWIGCIGLSAIVLFPNIQPDLAMLTIINEAVPSAFFRGLCISGLLAVVMSTADSHLNSATVAMVNDCILPLRKKPFSPKWEIWVLRLVTVFLGSSSIIIALHFRNLIDIVLTFMSFWGTFMAVPFFAGLYRLNASAKSFWMSTFMGIPTFLLWSKLFAQGTGVNAVFPGVLMSALGFFIVYFYEKKRGIIPPREVEIKEGLGLKKTQPFWWVSIRNFFINLKQKMITATDISEKQFALFSAFCVAGYLFPMFIWLPHDAPYYNLTTALRLISGILCVVLVFNENWPDYFKKYLPWSWYFILFYSLSFLSTFMFILNQHIMFWLLNMGLSSFLLAFLVDWESFLVILMLGIISAVSASYLVAGSSIFGSSFFIHLGYALFFSVIVGILFARRREQETEEKTNGLRNLSAIIAHEMRTPLVTFSLASQNFDIHIKPLIKYYKGETTERVLSDSVLNYLETMPSSLYTMSRENLVFIDIILKNFRGVKNVAELSQCNIKDCVEDALLEFPFVSDQRTLVNIEKVEDFPFFGDKALATHLLFNLLSNSLNQIKKAGHGQIRLWTSAKNINMILHFEDTAGGISQQFLPKIFAHFASHGKKDGTGIGLAFCREVMECFGGSIKCCTDSKTITEFQMIFPSYNKELSNSLGA